MQAFAIVAASVSGMAAGWLWGQVPVRPFVQNIGAAACGWVAGTIGTIFVTLFTAAVWSPGAGGLGAVSAGFSETLLLGLPAVVVFVSVARFALRPLLAAAPAVLATYAAIMIGGACALCAALWVAGGIVVSH